MSIQSEIDRIKGNVASAYSAVEEMGGNLPEVQNSANLAAAVSTIPVGAGWSNPNLLDNWYLVNPVNQRAQEVYEEIGYTVDRWRSTRGKVKLTEDGLLVTADDLSQQRSLLQYLENRDLIGKTVTLSVLTSEEFVSGTGVFPAETGGAVNMAFGKDISLLIRHMSNGYPLVDIWVNANKSAVIKAVKLELGTQQTLARQDADGNWVLNDPPPDQALELVKCQRYQVVISPKSNYNNFTVALAFLSTSAYFFLPFKMRVNPTIAGDFTAENIALRDNAGASAPVKAIYASGDGQAGINLNVVTDDVLTPGKAYIFKLYNTPLILDANI